MTEEETERMDTANKWERVSGDIEEAERIYRKSRTFLGDVWYRFRRKPTALCGFILVLLLLIFCLAGPAFTPYSYSEQNNKMASIPPVLTVYPGPAEDSWIYITQGLKMVEVDGDGYLVRQLKKKKDDAALKRTSFTWDGDTLVYLDYSTQPNTVLDTEGNRVENSKRLWNRTYLLGTDQLGRDILTRLMYGTRISLMVAFIAALVNMIIGIAYGGISGYLGGRTDAIMMRIVDIISTIPLTLYVILIKMCLDDGLLSIIIALSSVYWVDMARVVRGEMLSLKNQEFVLAARTIGSSTKTILLNHLIPNAMGPILVTVTMLIPSAIFMEAFMSFIGIGIAPPMASLGTMCNDATETLRTNPYQLFLPALVICMIMFAFNFVGDGLRDALDPKLKK
jgi:ABC-type dipeptide/oligopeptide/nickel transport systems, permease components